ncbi:TPA: ead/Ea22-like family protein [Klebsiella quasipneumoniae subsp. similipneumoniae]|nr:ead/Ea22-like family protein [Klebsiella quasipneumoniae subsp. similipneumoniae]
MIDITELAQRLKASAEKATPGQWERGDGKHGGELLVYCDDALGSAVCEATSEYNAIPKYQRIDNLDFIALANPANILALVEALESEKRICATWRKTATAVSEKLEKAQQCITELKSRTVKLVDCDFGAVQHMSGGSTDYCHGFVDGTQNAIRAITAAGIKVEAE